MNLGLETRRVGGESSAKPAAAAGAGGAAARKGPYEDELVTARRYFFAGFLALPLLWFFMAVHYYSMSRKSDAPKELRTYVNLAAAGSMLLLAGTVAWVTFYLQYWDKKQSFYDLLVVALRIEVDW